MSERDARRAVGVFWIIVAVLLSIVWWPHWAKAIAAWSLVALIGAVFAIGLSLMVYEMFE